MQRLSLTLLSLGYLLFAASSAHGQTVGPLAFHQHFFDDHVVTTHSSLELTPAALPGETLEQHTLRIAELLLIDNGYLTSAPLKGQLPRLQGSKLAIIDGAITLSWSVPGGPDLVIVLSNGTFLPSREQVDLRWIQITEIRQRLPHINNGY